MHAQKFCHLVKSTHDKNAEVLSKLHMTKCVSGGKLNLAKKMNFVFNMVKEM